MSNTPKSKPFFYNFGLPFLYPHEKRSSCFSVSLNLVLLHQQAGPPGPCPLFRAISQEAGTKIAPVSHSTPGAALFSPIPHSTVLFYKKRNPFFIFVLSYILFLAFHSNLPTKTRLCPFFQEKSWQKKYKNILILSLRNLYFPFRVKVAFSPLHNHISFVLRFFKKKLKIHCLTTYTNVTSH